MSEQLDPTTSEAPKPRGVVLPTALVAMLPAEMATALRAELRVLAEAMLRSERPGHTLQPTALLHELWLKLVKRTDLRFDSTNAFLAYAVEGIRHILVDHARRRLADRRGGRRSRVPLDPDSTPTSISLAHGPADPVDHWAVAMIELSDELDLLRTEDLRSARVFELRFIGGMSNEQIAALLGVTPRTVQKDWAAARGWLGARLELRSTSTMTTDAKHPHSDG